MRLITNMLINRTRRYMCACVIKNWKVVLEQIYPDTVQYDVIKKVELIAN